MRVVINYHEELFDSCMKLEYTDVCDIGYGTYFHVLLFDEKSKKSPVILNNDAVVSVETFSN